jgi:FlaA1/EpsC-like NDP-sugar epimerase
VTFLEANNSGETVLITGAGGCIGSALARSIVGSGAKRVVLLDHSEQNLYEIHTELAALAGVALHLPVVGDICDKALLDELLDKYRPDTIFHAAAFKHVPLMEANPIAVIRNNIIGTWTLASAALEYRVRQLVMISTDKAANPRSVMGAAKRVAELTILRLSNPKTRMSALRLVNVLGSSGSVVPLFKQQIRSGGPVTVTHPDCRRYFLSLPETTELMFAAAALNQDAAILIPELGAPAKILDLAKNLIGEAGPPAAATEIVFTELRPGDKLTEDLTSTSECLASTSHPKLLKIAGLQPSPKRLDAAIQVILKGVSTRNLTVLLETLCDLVPEYQPSRALQTARNRTSVGAQHCCAGSAPQ